jgi:antitoxin component YwqK of YwqJK toxin-antitoxin module
MAKLVKKYTNWGTLKAEYFAIIDKKGKEIIEGQYKEFLDSGCVVMTVNYVNGKKNGVCTRYFTTDGKTNGTLSSLCYYVNDKLEGKYIDYYSNNIIHIECYYVNNKKHGEYKEYYKSFHINEQGENVQNEYKITTYNNDQLHGVYKEYYEPTVDKEIYLKNYIDSYINGKITGLYKEYRKDGKLKEVTCYINSIRRFRFEIDEMNNNINIDEDLDKQIDIYYNKIISKLNLTN